MNRLFDNDGRFMDSTLRLWPGLLALAILLNLFELALRKWGGIVESFRRPDARKPGLPPISRHMPARAVNV